MTPFLVIIFVLELLLLIPWFPYAALAVMAFDSGFSWLAVMLVAPLWSYPVLLLLFGITSLILAYFKRQKCALIAILSPLIIPLLCYLIIGLYQSIPTEEYLQAEKIFNEKCKSVEEYIYIEPKEINGLYVDYDSNSTKLYSFNANGELLKWRHEPSSSELIHAGVINFYETKNSPNKIAKGEKKYRRYYAAPKSNPHGYSGQDVGKVLSEYGLYHDKFETEVINKYKIGGGHYRIVDLRKNKLIAETSYYSSIKLKKFCGNAPGFVFSGHLFAKRVFESNK